MNSFIDNDYIRALVIFAGAVVLARIVQFIINRFFKRFAARTKTDLDDKIIQIVRKPVNLLIYTGGLYFALRSLALQPQYEFWIARVSYALIVIIFAVVVARTCSLLVGRWLKVEKRYEQTPKLINKVVAIIVYVIAILMILRHFNVEITPLIATLGVGGLAVGLALQSTLSNLFSGLFIISDKPVNVGDFVELNVNGLAGYVEDIGWRTTRIRTLPNTIVVVPNSKLADSIIINNSMPQLEMAALVQCGVAYGSDLVKVERVTIDVATQIQKTVEGAVPDFQPFIRYHTFADSNINFSIILRVKTYVDQYLVTHEFIKALSARYTKENIEISWPVRKVVQG